MNRIIRRLFQGNIEDAKLVAKGNQGFNWIVYLGQDMPSELSFDSKVPVIHIPLKDGADNIHKWEIASSVITTCELRGKTLVACRGGISRSPMMCVFFLFRNKLQTDYDRGVKYIKTCIREFQPNQDIVDMIKEVCK